jgi:zinc protease
MSVEIKAGAKVSEHRLRNGMRVLVAERHGDPVVASVLYYPVGARNETEREAGVSHFLEHMMFKGSRRFGKGEVDRVTTELGGQNNAFTGYDHTAYWFEFASDRWERALDLEADRMTALLLDEAEFDSERAVVLEELAMGEDDPWRVLARHVESALFPRHPYGRPIIGYPDTLAGMGPGEMRDYYRRFYHPGNATLVIAGDVSRTRALRAVRERFGKLPAGQPYADADPLRPPLEEPPGERRVETRWDDEASRLLMAWPTVPVGTDEDYALDLALIVLASGRLSRLQRRLVFDGGLASSVSASNDTRVDGGAFWLFAEASQGVEPAELERVLDEELAQLATKKVSAAELRRAKAIMRSSDAFEGETVSDLAEELGEWAVDYDWRAAFDGSVRHDAVTAEEVRRAIARFLVPGRRVVGWSLPRVVALPARGGARKRKASGRAAKKGARGS